MIEKKLKSKKNQSILVIGSGGFMGSHLVPYLEETSYKVYPITSSDINLLHDSSEELLLPLIEKVDSVVMLSALTPDKGKDVDTYIKNITMAKHVSGALKKAQNKPHVLYISSDAVYNLDKTLVSEETLAAPSDSYGSMHRAREIIFQETVGSDRLAVLRPTLVYGPGDTHNSYGPNRFRREAFEKGTISIFGEGLDTRSHIYIKDLVCIIEKIISFEAVGVLNAASDISISFYDLAMLVSDAFEKPVQIIKKPGAAQTTYRKFDPTLCYTVFPDFSFTSLKEGLKKTIDVMVKDRKA